MSDSNISQSYISQNTVVAQVMNRLKDSIASGQYRPGDRLPTEAELAEMYGVGRSSIREAMKVFQHLGVVETKAAKGTILRDRAKISIDAITWALLLGQDDLQDVMQLREVIEASCFAKLAQGNQTKDTTTSAILIQMEKIVDEMGLAAERKNLNGVAEADYQFHSEIIKAGGNQLFIDLFHTLHAFMSKEILASYQTMGSLLEVAEDHRDILRTLRSEPVAIALARHQAHFERTHRLLNLEWCEK